MISLPISGGVPGVPPSAEAGKDQSLGRDDFLRLLVAQLEHQDPSKPLESTDFTAQLAQFSELDQIFELNDRLQTLVHLQTSSAQLNLVGFIGKEIETFYTRGQVSGVGFDGQEPVLFVNGQSIPLSDVEKINQFP